MKKIIYLIPMLFFFFCKGKVDNTKRDQIHDTIIQKKENQIYTAIIPKKVRKEIGLINDSDGYTNARKKPSSSSEVLFRILEGEYFTYVPLKESNWSEIETLDGKIAYVHNSRIKKVNPNTIITFFSSYYDNKEEKDGLRKNIININKLDESKAFSINSFPYPRLSIKKKSNDTIFLLSKDKKKSIEIIAGSFEKDKHSIEFDENNFISRIDSKKVFGNDKTPLREIKRITVNNDIRFNLDKDIFNNLYEPNFDNIEVYIKDSHQLILVMTNGYGSINSYKSILIFDKEKLLRHINYIPF